MKAKARKAFSKPVILTKNSRIPLMKQKHEFKHHIGPFPVDKL